MKKRENQDADRRREIVKHTLEGAVALGALYGLSRRLVTKNGYLRNHGIEGEDIAHTVAVKLLQKAEQFRGDSKPSTWIHRVAVNASIDEADKAVNRQEIPEDPRSSLLSETDTKIGPEYAVIMSEERAKILQAIKELSEDQQVVIFKHYFEGLSYEEIAEELHIPVNTAKSHALRGRELLRVLLQEEAPTSTERDGP